MTEKEYIEIFKSNFNIDIKLSGNDCAGSESGRHYYEDHKEYQWCNKCGRRLEYPIIMTKEFAIKRDSNIKIPMKRKLDNETLKL